MNFLILLFFCFAVAIQGFKITPSKSLFSSKMNPSLKLNSIKITDNVEFDTIAREWRLKWSSENEKQSLSLVQEKLGSILPTLQKIEGVKNVQRVVCGGCLDFKIITSVSAEKFQEWESKGFYPEKLFLDAIKSISGVSHVETQTYTLMTL